MNFDSIIALLSAASAISAILAAAALVAFIGFMTWASRTVGSFFDVDGDPIDEDSDYECLACGYVMGGDTAISASSQGYCPKCGESV